MGAVQQGAGMGAVQQGQRISQPGMSQGQSQYLQSKPANMSHQGVQNASLQHGTGQPSAVQSSVTTRHVPGQGGTPASSTMNDRQVLQQQMQQAQQQKQQQMLKALPIPAEEQIHQAPPLPFVKENEIKRKRLFVPDLRKMMYGFGDHKAPLPETVDLMDDIVHDFVVRMAIDDILFLVRKHPKMYYRARELARTDKELTQARNATEGITKVKLK
ncbi:hypothetical protein GUITHDRAFT_116598 [Guillardia theta CCMP2712]|uniref:Transcription initiation factor TFIID subunit 13 n=1 Tax=Guillardia theta (strain CCMP2712) TaxID=905079 RepID=L1IMR6_GUITC|nr:hypothetical protein GUITHDRAFT_116598 [Guillardia theta CCMP2712]EKX37184.1 hypothetical protein GUITHDRAFT_116598 [Guillardia theta CCMP2712]|eukprot:XP_005824164.1 hypothetical protein GUITHDRAFT_116598 [Guillardia theta CCMP2712]